MTNDPCLDEIEDYINQDQRSVCVSDAQYIIVEGVAGSRKTDTLVRLGLRRHWRQDKNILFLTQVGSVTDEICSRVGKYLNTNVYRQGGSNHHIALSRGKTIEVANFDAWVHRQLQDQEWKHLSSMGSYHAFKAKSLNDLDNFKGFCLKNGQYADEVLIDECQDFDPIKANLIVSLLRKSPNVRAVFCGDYMQTIFEKSLDDHTHPLSIFASLPCARFYMQQCFRCPAGHISFCNKILHGALEKYNCKPLLSVRNDHDNKPFLFTHGSTSKKYDAHVLVSQLCQMTDTLISNDSTLKPSDFCYMMRKSNNQPVFELLRVALEKMWASHGHHNSIVHFMTQYDGYRNPIQWNQAVNKSCLISIHGDKGKGHKVVFFIGLTQKSIPDECSMHKQKELLFHSLLNVALTRSTQYLFVGFHYAQPSVYLTKIVNDLPALTYSSWRDNRHPLYDQFVALSKFPRPDFVKQIYRTLPLQVPMLNMISITDMSRRFERPEDIFGFSPRIGTIKFGSRIRLDLPDDVYPVIAKMCELILIHDLKPDLFLSDIQWFPHDVIFTDDVRVLSWVHDFHLHKWIHSDMYEQQLNLIMDTFKHIITNEPPLHSIMEQIRKRKTHVMNSCFNTPRFHKCIQAFLEQHQQPHHWWDLALLFHGNTQHIDIPPLRPDRFLRLLKNIKNFTTHLSADVVFRPCHDILANISDQSTLEGLGFEQGLDSHYFTNGYYYGILGTSGILDRTHSSIYDIKVSPVDFSTEWFFQTSFHASMPSRKSPQSPEKIIVANLLTGKMHSWDNHFLHPRKLIKRIMNNYSFPEPLSDNLYKMNRHRFKCIASTTI